MKKQLLSAALSLMLLAGCSSGGGSTSGKSTACSMDMEGVGVLNVTVNGDADDKLTGFGMSIVMDEELLSGIDLSGLDDDTKALLEESLISSMGIDPQAQGVTVSADFGETLTVNVDIDLATADADALAALGMDGVDWSTITYDAFVERLTADGTMTCE